ncbi:MAG: hypothetical protein MMC33_004329 [Icmadophila ericetorum]|nr:hypothetical protein [Icmadophila ericetorum]
MALSPDGRFPIKIQQTVTGRSVPREVPGMGGSLPKGCTISAAIVRPSRAVTPARLFNELHKRVYKSPQALPPVVSASTAAATNPEVSQTLPTNLSVAHRFRDTWLTPLCLSITTILSLYTPTAQWYDHHIRLHLTTPLAILQSRTRFLSTYDDFVCETYAINPTPTGAVVQLIFSGVFARDLLPVRKASGRRWNCHVCFVLGVDEEGRVERVDEYFPRDFDEGVGVDGYVVRHGGDAVVGSGS